MSTLGSFHWNITNEGSSFVSSMVTGHGELN